jgi:predicted transcriptional regulator
MCHSQSFQRSHLQLLEEILSLCSEPKVKTQIMHETGITLKKLQYCLKQLLGQNMIEFHHRKKTYTTTQTGARHLQLLTGLRE